jgi:hypothetical protein
MINALDHRKSDYPVEKLFVARWSPRAMTGEPLTETEINTLFEAGRWAPSTYNEQEWRFLYASRDTPQWQTFFDLLVEGKKAWCRNAAMLVVIVPVKSSIERQAQPGALVDVSRRLKTSRLQGTAMSLVVHGMQGFRLRQSPFGAESARRYAVASMFAASRPKPISLPEGLRDREKPSDRKPSRKSFAKDRSRSAKYLSKQGFAAIYRYFRLS